MVSGSHLLFNHLENAGLEKDDLIAQHDYEVCQLQDRIAQLELQCWQMTRREDCQKLFDEPKADDKNPWTEMKSDVEMLPKEPNTPLQATMGSHLPQRVALGSLPPGSLLTTGSITGLMLQKRTRRANKNGLASLVFAVLEKDLDKATAGAEHVMTQDKFLRNLVVQLQEKAHKWSYGEKPWQANGSLASTAFWHARGQRGGHY
jgi:hypothetical protein